LLILLHYYFFILDEITGAWFYEESECSRISQKLIALVKEESQRRRPSAAQQNKPVAGVDILSLLTKAHGEYEQASFIYLFINLSTDL